MDYRPYLASAALPADEPDIDALATEMGVDSLPADYLEFLRQSNGGIPLHPFLVIEDGVDVHGAVLSRFFAVNNEPCSVAFETALRQDNHQLPAESVVIAEDANGNLLILSLRADDSQGEVHFWDHEAVPTDQIDPVSMHDYVGITRVALSFSDLVQSQLYDERTYNATLSQQPQRPAKPTSRPPVVRSPRISHKPRSGIAEGLEICRLASDSGARQTLISNDALDPVNINDGQPLADRWETVEARLPDAEPPLDMPYKTPSVLLLNQRALDVLGAVLQDYGELLELSCAGKSLHMFRCLNVVDALVPGTPVENNPISHKGWQFDPAKTIKAGVFTVPQQAAHPWIFYPSSILQLISTAKLRHTHFELVWDATSGARALFP